MFKRVIEEAHEVLKKVIHSEDTVIDATAGNGNDTLFLSRLATTVIAFDINPKAIKATQDKLHHHAVTNVKLIEDSHAALLSYVHTPVKAIVFNLGYFPGEPNHALTTRAQTTLQAIEKGLTRLCLHGLISITVYVGHDEGTLESSQIETYVKQLSPKKYQVLKTQHLNTKKAPYNIFIYKIA